MKQIAVLGSTGSIGTSCLDVVRSLDDRLAVFAMTAHRQWEPLAEQAAEFSPAYAVLGDPEAEKRLRPEPFPQNTKLLFGPEAIEQVAAMPEVDIVVSGHRGSGGAEGDLGGDRGGKDRGRRQ